MDLLPPHTAYATGQLLEPVESLDRQVTGFEPRIKRVFKPTLAIQRLTTLPGVGLTLAVVIAREVGDVPSFPDAERLASYAGTTPRVRAERNDRHLSRPLPLAPVSPASSRFARPLRRVNASAAPAAGKSLVPGPTSGALPSLLPGGSAARYHRPAGAGGRRGAGGEGGRRETWPVAPTF
jgi:transposase